MKKTYIKANIEIIQFDNVDIITTSSTEGLKNGGENGTGNSESFDSLFK